MCSIPKKVNFIIILCLLFAKDYGQQRQLQFTHLDINQGLIHNQVNCIAKDARGFLWFGTPSGLSRYDGYSVKNFRHSNTESGSLSENYIIGIYPLPEGKLWINTRKGSSLFDPITEYFDTLTSAYLKRLFLPQGQVKSIRKDTAGRYWYIYPDAVAMYQPAKWPSVLPRVRIFLQGNNPNKSTNQQTANKVSLPSSLSDLAVQNSGSMWIIESTGAIENKNIETGECIYRNDSIEKMNLGLKQNYQVFLDSDQDLWIYAAGTPGSINYFDTHKKSWRIFKKQDNSNSLNNDIINAVAQDARGNIWVGTDHGGINLINKKDFSFKYLINNKENVKSLAQNCIYCIYKDDLGILWVGTYKKGVCYYNEGFDKFPLYSHDPSTKGFNESLPYEDVNRFVEDEKGNLWIGTNGGGLIYYDRKNGTYKQYQHENGNPGSLCANVIVGLCYDSKGRLWIGTYYGGLDCYYNGQFKHYRHEIGNPHSLSDDLVWDIYEDRQKNIWVGTLGGGLDQYDPTTDQFRIIKSSDNSIEGIQFILVITQLKNNDLWVGTANGIDVYGSDNIHHYSYLQNDTNSISNDNINALYQDSRGWVWIGTREGLNAFNPGTGKFRRFSTQDGLPDNTILTILEDAQGDIWMSTPGGITRLHPPRTFDAEKKQFLFKNFDESDGLQGREFNEKSAYKTQEGELIFGGANGYNLFDSRKIQIDSTTPPLVFTDLQVLGKSVQIGESIENSVILSTSISETSSITLPYGASDFSLTYSALGYAHSSRIKYTYRLKGFSDQWIISDNSSVNKATYTNLDPGDYQLEVRACNQDGIWNPKTAVMQIHILPPFWKTNWAYVIYILLLLGILYLGRSFLLYRAQMRFQLQRQTQDAQHTHEMDMMKIKFFTNISHEFRTPLSLILLPLENLLQEIRDLGQKKQLEMVQRNGKRLLFLVNQLLDFRKMEEQEIKLNPVRGELIGFIKDCANSFSDIAEKKHINFSIASSVNQINSYFDPDKLERILFNLLSNAFKFTPEKGKIQLSLTLSNKNMNRTQPDGTENLLIEVRDNGIGIAAQNLKRIFERFFQQDSKSHIVNPGTGIGLAITYEFVRLHNGIIEVSSEEGKGACFIIQLPIEPWSETDEKEVLNLPVDMDIDFEKRYPIIHTEELPKTIMQSEQRDSDNFSGEMEEKSNRRKPTIVLIEDNEDFRFYLKDNLKMYFNIVEAVDGKLGWEKVVQVKPDLIVSDILMPNWDGLELCRRIKKDPRTSGIPVILLTARASEKQQLEGIEAGANDYITKPFNFKVLLAKIQNILFEIKKRDKALAPKIAIEPSETVQQINGQKFVQQALLIVEKNLSEPDFSVDHLSRELFISRVTLYKKMMATVGKTPLEFIRMVRIKKAAQLLKTGEMNIAEVAYAVGFNNPKYFTKYFKQQFGILPSEYSKQKNPEKDEQGDLA